MLANLLYVLALVILVADTTAWGISVTALVLIVFASVALGHKDD